MVAQSGPGFHHLVVRALVAGERFACGGLGESGSDAVDIYVGGSELAGQGGGEPDHGELCDAVYRFGGESPDGSLVHDGTAASLDHFRDDGTGAMPGAFQIDIEGLVPQIGGE